MRAPDWLTARPVAHRGLHDISRGIVENMPAAAQAARFSARVVAVQPSLASTISSEPGAAARTARMRSASPGCPSFTLSSGRSAALAAASAMTLGEASEIV